MSESLGDDLDPHRWEAKPATVEPASVLNTGLCWKRSCCCLLSIISQCSVTKYCSEMIVEGDGKEMVCSTQEKNAAHD